MARFIANIKDNISQFQSLESHCIAEFRSRKKPQACEKITFFEFFAMSAQFGCKSIAKSILLV